MVTGGCGTRLQKLLMTVLLTALLYSVLSSFQFRPSASGLFSLPPPLFNGRGPQHIYVSEKHPYGLQKHMIIYLHLKWYRGPRYAPSVTKTKLHRLQKRLQKRTEIQRDTELQKRTEIGYKNGYKINFHLYRNLYRYHPKI